MSGVGAWCEGRESARDVATLHDDHAIPAIALDVCIGNAAVTQHRVAAALLLLMVLARYVLRRLRDIRQRQCRPFTTRFCNSILYEYPGPGVVCPRCHDGATPGTPLTATCLPTESTFVEHTCRKQPGYRAALEINSNYESIKRGVDDDSSVMKTRSPVR